MSFLGIPGEMSEFFMQIRFNNDAAFFNEHKKEYERDVKQPLFALADALAPAALAIDPALETRAQKVVSRIRRDTRFSRDKSPYRDHMWIGWRPVRAADTERKQQIPGLYFSVGIKSWDVGVGYYEAAPATMKAFREKVAAAPSVFLSLVENIAPFQLMGDDYSRPPKGIDEMPPELRPWYAKKSFYVEYSEPLGERARQPEFYQEIASRLSALGPLYRYLCALPAE